MTKYHVVLCLVLASALCSFSFYTEGNHIPVVNIVAPVNGSSVSRSSNIDYRINVTDKEDGSTKYEEITQEEVFLKVKYLSSVKQVPAYLQKEKQLAKAFLTMRQSDCFNCHAVKQKLAGPSFSDIAVKYGATAATYERLSKKIMKGSRGAWGDTQMPAHLNIKKEAATAIAKLVIQYGSDANFDLYRGTEGIITLNKKKVKSPSSVMLLTAYYLDHGIEMKNRKEGSTTIRFFLK